MLNGFTFRKFLNRRPLLFRKRNPVTYEQMYHRFRKPILRYVRKRVANEAVAEEITQEIFLKVHRYFGSYDPSYAFSTWLWTIARNTLSDHFRSRKDSHVQETISADEIPCERGCAETILVNRDLRKRLFAQARSLTRLQRRVLWMRVFRQLSFPEISARLGLSLTSVKNLAYRARLKLGEELELAPAYT